MKDRATVVATTTFAVGARSDAEFIDLVLEAAFLYLSVDVGSASPVPPARRLKWDDQALPGVAPNAAANTVARRDEASRW